MVNINASKQERKKNGWGVKMEIKWGSERAEEMILTT